MQFYFANDVTKHYLLKNYKLYCKIILKDKLRRMLSQV